MDVQMKSVIDADFFRNITEYERGTGLFLNVLDELHMNPVMHEFVIGTELKDNKYLRYLLDGKMISVVYYRDYLSNDIDRAEYEKYFIAAYERVNRFEFPEGNDIYEYAESGESLGEIRSLYMAKKMGYQYFMSDDADARLLAKTFFSSKRSVEVKSLFDVLVLCKEKNTRLKWTDINPTVCNAMQKRQDRIKQLKELYNK